MLTFAPDPSPIVASEKISADMRPMIGSLWPHSPLTLAASTVCQCSLGAGDWISLLCVK